MSYLYTHEPVDQFLTILVLPCIFGALSSTWTERDAGNRRSEVPEPLVEQGRGCQAGTGDRIGWQRTVQTMSERIRSGRVTGSHDPMTLAKSTPVAAPFSAGGSLAGYRRCLHVGPAG